MKILQLLVAEVTDGYDCESQSSNIESENQNTASVSQEVSTCLKYFRLKKKKN